MLKKVSCLTNVLGAQKLEISVQRHIKGFTAAELFQIAAHVETYPKFLPFCIAARILEDVPEGQGHDQKVDNVFGMGPFRSRFITHALLEEPDRIHITSNDPQFEVLSITWKFMDEFQDRLVLGLDCCSAKENLGHVEWFQQAKDDGNISTEVYEKIVWKNINQLLDLGIKD